VTRHVAYAEFARHLDRYMDEASREPLHVERDDGSILVIHRMEESRSATAEDLMKDLNADVSSHSELFGQQKARTSS
jgi:hypothetical protein